MNQILFTDYNYFYNRLNYKKVKKYILFFHASISICVLILLYLSYTSFARLEQTEKTNLLKDKYNINRLYPINNNYNTLKISDNISIIGLIAIPKINLSYPIIENSNEDLLKISVCRFSGPFPNRIGNLCIAGHNYKNNLMFSKLYKLDIGDSIYITDLNNTNLKYIVYDKLNVKENELDCMENTNTIEITLITCNSSNNSERIVIKAKMEG